ncbi:hypothetical protein [Nocardia flavorosea]|uniref:WXG100 family type VII secretion target n=1 Tax=Nocardia flavorosea TaxID=53429 RepID=A0A846YPM1_9NOCA|nr:hypothetical protein [Nocardia flavorosea]NKY61047.1 hypothetical protein [Nocardia flavorosea]
MTDNPYPNLGYNPVPGVPDDVAGLSNRVETAAEAVRETNDLLARLRNSNDEVWRGEAGDAFRSHFDATLAQDLGYTQSSLERAVTVLGEWNTALVGFRDQAKALDQEAGVAAAEVNKAVTEVQNANANPDLGLANQVFDDPAALQAAQTRLNAATARVNAANTALDNWLGTQDSIAARARDLATEHENVAKRIASELDTAAKDFAPSEPDKSIWDKIKDAIGAIGEWIDEHREGIHTALAITASVAGLLALVTPPPVSAIALGVSLAAGAGALALDFTDPEIREGLMSGDMSAWMTVGGDALSVVPGGAALGKAAWAGVRGLDDVSRMEGMLNAWQAGAHDPGIVMKGLAVPVDSALSAAAQSAPAIAPVYKILQVADIAGTSPLPSAAPAMAILSRAGSSVANLVGLGGDE